MLWECLSCTTRYAVGLERCPHCGSTDYAEVDSGGRRTAPEPAADDQPPAVPAKTAASTDKPAAVKTT